MWLADSETVFPKAIFVILAIVFWAIQTTMKSLKAQRDQRLDRERRVLTAPAVSDAYIPPTPTPPPIPAAMRRTRMMAMGTKQRVAQKAKRSAAPPPVPTYAVPPTLVRSVLAPQLPAAPSVPNATAASLRQWLRPENLRAEFILVELLQPPAALRPPEDRWA